MKLPGWIIWIITHLLGSHALDNLSARIEAAIAAQLAANPSLSKDAAVAFAVKTADALIAPVMALPLFGLAGPIIEPILNEQLAVLAGKAYDVAVAKIEAAAGQLTAGLSTT